jgi:hypothetical protein
MRREIFIKVPMFSLLIDKYRITFDDGKIYFVDDETKEAMEVRLERIVKLIRQEFKHI